MSDLADGRCNGRSSEITSSVIRLYASVLEVLPGIAQTPITTSRKRGPTVHFRTVSDSLARVTSLIVNADRYHP